MQVAKMFMGERFRLRSMNVESEAVNRSIKLRFYLARVKNDSFANDRQCRVKDKWCFSLHAFVS